MRRFYCGCGQEVYFDSRFCVACQRLLAYEPIANALHALQPLDELHYRDSRGDQYRFCRNRLDYGVCNNVLAAASDADYCRLCLYNNSIPAQSSQQQLQQWGAIEQAKRRLYYGLYRLGLQGQMPQFDIVSGNAKTGYANGLITMLLSEADEVQRVWQKQRHSEVYRTVLGHLRHEMGHFFYARWQQPEPGFVALFGNPQLDYQTALALHYRNGPLSDWQRDFISAYAASHPLEDWAESFAHYLHIHDLVETAQAFGLLHSELQGFGDILHAAAQFGPLLNELNRSLGVEDAYPFVFSDRVSEKLRYIDGCVAKQQ